MFLGAGLYCRRLGHEGPPVSGRVKQNTFRFLFVSQNSFLKQVIEESSGL